MRKNISIPDLLAKPRFQYLTTVEPRLTDDGSQPQVRLEDFDYRKVKDDPEIGEGLSQEAAIYIVLKSHGEPMTYSDIAQVIKEYNLCRPPRKQDGTPYPTTKEEDHQRRQQVSSKLSTIDRFVVFYDTNAPGTRSYGLQEWPDSLKSWRKNITDEDLKNRNTSTVENSIIEDSHATLSDGEEYLLEEILSSWKSKRNVLLFGPPGTGKTRIVSTLFHQLQQGLDRYDSIPTPIKVVWTTFHQSYGYEDFVLALVPEVSGGGQSFKDMPVFSSMQLWN